MACPWVSLMCLKPSTSQKSKATVASPAPRRSIDAETSSTKEARLGSPVSGSCSAAWCSRRSISTDSVTSRTAASARDPGALSPRPNGVARHEIHRSVPSGPSSRNRTVSDSPSGRVVSAESASDTTPTSEATTCRMISEESAGLVATSSQPRELHTLRELHSQLPVARSTTIIRSGDAASTASLNACAACRAANACRCSATRSVMISTPVTSAPGPHNGSVRTWIVSPPVPPGASNSDISPASADR